MSFVREALRAIDESSADWENDMMSPGHFDEG
jgi:hypothetical protein